MSNNQTATDSDSAATTFSGENASDQQGRPEIDNPERGCGYLKPNKAYLRADVGPGGSLPTFIEFESPIPFKDDRKRSYKRFPGLAWELSVTGEGGMTETVPEGEALRHIERLGMDRPTGTHAGSQVAFHAHDLLLSVGKTHYPSPQDFMDEAKVNGVSKAISVTSGNTPPEVNPGRTRLFLIHPKAVEQTVEVEIPMSDFDPDVHTMVELHIEDDENRSEMVLEDTIATVTKEGVFPGIIGYTYLTRVVYTEDEDGEVPSYVEDYEEMGDLDIVKPGTPRPYSEQKYRDEKGNITEAGRDLLDNWEQAMTGRREGGFDVDPEASVMEAYKQAITSAIERGNHEAAAQMEAASPEVFERYDQSESEDQPEYPPSPHPANFDGEEVVRQLDDAEDEIRAVAESGGVVDLDALDRAPTGQLADAGDWMDAEAPPTERDRLLDSDGDVLAIVELDGVPHRVDASATFKVNRSPEDGYPFTEGVGILGPYKVEVKDTDDGRSVRVERTR